MARRSENASVRMHTQTEVQPENIVPTAMSTVYNGRRYESKRSMLFANRGVLSCFTYSAVTSPLATGSCSSHTAASSPAFLWIGCEAGARCAILFISRVLLIFSRISFLSSSMKCVPNKRAIKPSTAHDEPRTMLAFGSWTANNKHLIQ